MSRAADHRQTPADATAQPPVKSHPLDALKSTKLKSETILQVISVHSSVEHVPPALIIIVN